MGFKIKNIFSYLIASFIYLLFKSNEAETVIENKINNKFIIVDSNNCSEIYQSKWIVFTDCDKINMVKLSQNTDCNFALLRINCFNNARIAAKLGIQNFDDVLKIENGKVENITNNIEGVINDQVTAIDALDFLLYFQVLNFRTKLPCDITFESYLTTLMNIIID